MIQRIRWLFIGASLLVVGAALFILPPYRIEAEITAGRLAKEMCSCIYVSQRSFAACRLDMPQALDGIEVAPLESDSQRGVRAWQTGLADRRAVHDEAFGCLLR
jgi:hypothetical protein